MANTPEQQINEIAFKAPLITILSDQSLDRSDAFRDSFNLGFNIGPVYDILRHPDTRTPMSIAIYGDWGSGKTSAMGWLDCLLDKWTHDPGAPAGRVKVRTVWFYPWKYHTKEDVWRGLIAEIILASIRLSDPSVPRVTKAMKQFGAFLGRSFMRALSSIEVEVPLGPNTKAKWKADELNKVSEDYSDTIQPHKAYLNDFEETLRTWVKDTIGEKERLVVFVDDLDRCLPDIALQVLEAIKLYLNVEKLVFIVGVDRQVIDELVIGHYDQLKLKSDKSKNYLAKMFQVEVNVAPSETQVETFLDGLLGGLAPWSDKKNLSEENRAIFRGVLLRLAAGNPRQVKRLINSALIAGAGATMVEGDQRYTFAQGMQVYLVARILQDRYQMPSVSRQRRGATFFDGWSNAVRSHSALPSRADIAALASEQDRDDALDRMDPAYRALAADPLYADLMTLLVDDDLAQLMTIAYPTDVARLLPDGDDSGGWKALRRILAQRLGLSEAEVNTGTLSSEESLDLTRSAVVDLTPLANALNLRRLWLEGTAVSSVEPLAKLQRLDRLSLASTPVTNIEPLGGLVELRELWLQGTRIESIEALAWLQKLERLSIEGTSVDSVTPLGRLEKLWELSVGRTPVSSIAPLSGLATMRRLYVHRSQVTDISAIEGMTALERLSVEACSLVDFAPIASLTDLEELWIGHTGLGDLRNLASLRNLRRLWMQGLPVTDLSVLAGLACLEEVVMSDSKVENLSPLEGHGRLRTLTIRRTGVRDLTPLARVPNLSSLSMAGSEVRDLTPLLDHPALRMVSVTAGSIPEHQLDHLRSRQVVVEVVDPAKSTPIVPQRRPR